MLKENFLNPDKEFTPIPFWFWNGDINEDELGRQIRDFYSKGVNGFLIHPRMGIPDNIKYMSEKFLDLVEFAVKEAAKHEMIVVLYDEAMYPSGSAHGMVAASNTNFKSRGLKRLTDKSELCHGDKVIYTHEGTIYAEGFTEGTIRGIHFGEDDKEYAAPKSTDLLNPEAIKLFINLTHDKYYERLKDYFGNTIIGMFTDEPCIMGRNPKEGMIPWGADFLEFYIEYGGKISDIPKLWENSEERTLYRKALTSKLKSTYYAPISKWCELHKISLMGHPEKSNDISLLEYFHIPGQDLVLRHVAPEKNTSCTGLDSTQAKCSSDAARHSGRRRNSNECFGACNRDNIPWNFTGSDMKWYIDWLCVRGVNMLIPHAFYYSIEGERKYERPPDVGPNNIWWDDYNIISNYIKRLCWLMTDSSNTAEIAVLCNEDNLECNEVAELYSAQIEFNYIESRYINEKTVSNGYINVRDNKYKILITPNGTELTGKSMDILKKGGVTVVNNVKESIQKYIQHGKNIDIVSPNLRVSHIKKSGKDFYLFVNEGNDNIDELCCINNYGYCEAWNPLTGGTNPIETNHFDTNKLSFRLQLHKRESIIIFIDKDKEPAKTKKKASATYSRQIDSDIFTISNDEIKKEIILEIGGKREYVKVFVNNKEAGARMWEPYSFNISSLVQAGENTIELFEKENKAYIYGGIEKPTAETAIKTLLFR